MLNEKAEQLLLASEGKAITCLKSSRLGQIEITVSTECPKEFRTITDGTTESDVEWEIALEELVEGGFVDEIEHSGPGTIYCVNPEGYQMIDEIKSSPDWLEKNASDSGSTERP